MEGLKGGGENVDKNIKCPYCDRVPEQIYEYRFHAQMEDMTPIEYVKREEGTFDFRTLLFCCSNCYIKIGMPSNERLHEAFRYYRRDVGSIEGLDNNYINQF